MEDDWNGPTRCRQASPALPSANSLTGPSYTAVFEGYWDGEVWRNGLWHDVRPQFWMSVHQHR